MRVLQFLFASMIAVKVIVEEQDRVVAIEHSSAADDSTFGPVQAPNSYMKDTVASDLNHMDDELEEYSLDLHSRPVNSA